MVRRPIQIASGLALLAAFALVSPEARADGFGVGDALNYGILFEGFGGNTLQITNVTVNGNVGVGTIGKATDSGPSTINGRLDFFAANSGQFSNNNVADVITGGVHYSVSAVGTDLSTVNTLNTAAGMASGAALTINGAQTVNVVSGMLESFDGTSARVFNVTSFNDTNGQALTIVGDAAHDNVVFNFTSSANLNGCVVLSGISANQVLFNFVGGSGGTGGPTMQLNTNASSASHYSCGAVWQGIILDPSGPMSLTNANLSGWAWGGDTHDFQYVSGSTLTVPTAVPEPGALTLLASGLVMLTSLRRRYAKA